MSWEGVRERGPIAADAVDSLISVKVERESCKMHGCDVDCSRCLDTLRHGDVANLAHHLG